MALAFGLDPTAAMRSIQANLPFYALAISVSLYVGMRLAERMMRTRMAEAAAAAKPSEPTPEPPGSTQVDEEAVRGWLARADRHRKGMGDGKLTTEHLVLAMADNPRFGEILSVADGITEDALKKAIKTSRAMYNRKDDAEPEPEKGPLEKYARELVGLAREGKLDPVVGRSDELRRVINILSRRTKNNPIVVGEPGTGKTALVEALALRIAAGDVPDNLKDCSILALDMGGLMAGAFFPGEFEERMKGILRELAEAQGKMILFIDDIHTVTGPAGGSGGGGMMDASVLLKPVLSRGEVRCIGCTTLDKFRKFIEKDPGLERRFQQVPIEPPNVQETVSILRGLRLRYESHHNMRISDTALVAAATLSDRYIPDRYLPDKAIDLVDEATAKVHMEAALKPEALDRVERKIRELEGERKLLARGARQDKSDAAELLVLDEQLSALRAQQVELYGKMEVERSEGEQLHTLQEEIDALSQEIESAQASGADSKAAALREARRAELLKKLRLKQRSAKKATGGRLPTKEVTEADIARIISKWTGIPLTKLVQSERARLLHLADDLHKSIIGQSEAVEAVAEAIQRSRAGMKDPNGPIASFLFLGPTGVGKTELAKALANHLFNSTDAMVRLDMSEYMEKHAVSKLIGAPPGYVGYDEGGQLTEQVRRKPYTVILFDEVEKAHVDVFNVLLQLLDDGRVTDSQGRVVNFKNAIIIMTSNLGSAEIFERTFGKNGPGAGAAAAAAAAAAGGRDEGLREVVMQKVRKHFQPEFLNRVDEFIIFDPLRPDQIKQIVGLRTRGVVARLAAEKKTKLELAPSAVEYLARKGYDPVYGARPVKRAVQRELETPLAKALLQGTFQEDDTIVVEANAEGTALEFQRIRGAGQGVGTGDDDSDAEDRADGPLLGLNGYRRSNGPALAAAAAETAATSTPSTSGSSATTATAKAPGRTDAKEAAPAAAGPSGRGDKASGNRKSPSGGFDPLRTRKRPPRAAEPPLMPPGGSSNHSSSSNGGDALAEQDDNAPMPPPHLRPIPRRDEESTTPALAG